MVDKSAGDQSPAYVPAPPISPDRLKLLQEQLEAHEKIAHFTAEIKRIKTRKERYLMGCQGNLEYWSKRLDELKGQEKAGK